ncbi:hypothetical protein V2J09_009967 [Rumex salicifolius]
MGRKAIDPSDASRWAYLTLLAIGVVSCTLAYLVMSIAFRSRTSFPTSMELRESGGSNSEGECCRGIPNLELWGSAVKWGTEFKLNSSEECCKACKAMCSGNAGPCLCDSWVFCGDKEACGKQFGECWLKKQTDSLAPQKQDVGSKVMWTSGLVFGRGEGIIGLETKYGTLHIKLYPDCAPNSVAYILELLQLRHCAGCQFHRAENRGNSWDINGNHLKDASYGPPFALLQGTLEAQGVEFKNIETEVCPTIRRGSVAWVGAGPEFLVSLANHEEWKRAYTVFGSVLPEDMKIVEEIAQLPTDSDVWNNVNVTILQEPVSFSLKRIRTGDGDAAQKIS